MSTPEIVVDDGNALWVGTDNRYQCGMDGFKVPLFPSRGQCVLDTNEGTVMAYYVGAGGKQGKRGVLVK